MAANLPALTGMGAWSPVYKLPLVRKTVWVGAELKALAALSPLTKSHIAIRSFNGDSIGIGDTHPGIGCRIIRLHGRGGCVNVKTCGNATGTRDLCSKISNTA